MVSSDDIRPAVEADAPQLAEIYNHYVLTSTITFEEEPVPSAEMGRRVRELQSASWPWLVAARDELITGFAYGANWKTRAAYRFAAEITIYVRQGCEHSGIGTRLYSALFSALKARGMHTVIGGVALPNEASLKLHQKFGFEKVAHFKRVGFKFNRWVDVTYWQLDL